MPDRTVVVIPGDGIGPEITRAALAVLEALDCGLEFVQATAGVSSLEAGGELLPQLHVEWSLHRNRH